MSQLDLPYGAFHYHLLMRKGSISLADHVFDAARLAATRRSLQCQCLEVPVRNDLGGRKQVSPEMIALAIAVGVFACGVVGLALQWMLHDKHTTGPMRDMVFGGRRLL